MWPSSSCLLLCIGLYHFFHVNPWYCDMLMTCHPRHKRLEMNAEFLLMLLLLFYWWKIGRLNKIKILKIISVSIVVLIENTLVKYKIVNPLSLNQLEVWTALFITVMNSCWQYDKIYQWSTELRFTCWHRFFPNAELVMTALSKVTNRQKED